MPCHAGHGEKVGRASLYTVLYGINCMHNHVRNMLHG
jgi:hypothetical protein